MRRAWAGLVALLLAQATVSLQTAAVERPLGRRLHAAACASEEQCAETEYCFRPGLGDSSGVCYGCWRCCLFPEAFGDCPESCKCVEGGPCERREDCSRGLFCSIEDVWDVPRCRRCDACREDRFEMYGSCSTVCPTADMSGLAALPRLTANDYLYLSFLALDISQQGEYVPSLLLADDLVAWVADEGLSGQQANATLARMLQPGEEAVPVQTWMDLFSSSSSMELTCPPYRLNATTLPTVVYPGCFCNATADARTFRCPAGSRCSRVAYRALDTDALRSPTGQLLRAVCVACEAGHYCPEGTYIESDVELSSLDCSAGYYCPTPAEQLECPPGSFCAARSTSPITCNYETLLSTEPYRKLPLEPESVITRLRDRRDPLRGNYCPAQATTSTSVCSAGYYCPNTSTKIVCPKGYYCKPQSTQPWKCTLLAPCPEGTDVPRLSYMAVVIAAIVLCGMPLIYLLLTHLDKSVMVEKDRDGQEGEPSTKDQTRQQQRFNNLRMLTSKWTGNPLLNNKYQGFPPIHPKITLEFHELGLQIRPFIGEPKTVLQGVSGAFAPNRLNAIMGPSGCGKTTFLNVLCGKVPHGELTGWVNINEQRMPISRIKQITGFVPQDDIVHEDLTVRENLNYSARMRLARDCTAAQRRSVVSKVLELLGLNAVQDYRVGTVEKRGISGGQRKRVNIGLELVAVPSLLFLDEPTSGLDATAAYDILHSLAEMTIHGMNIVMVIHQPRLNNYLVCDQVLLLSPGGRTVYLGSPQASYLYFDEFLGYDLDAFIKYENPCDVIIDIIAGQVPCQNNKLLTHHSQLVTMWEQSGKDWVRDLELLNPIMRTKVSDVDPRFIREIEAEFDRVDRDGEGKLGPLQLMELFNDWGKRQGLEQPQSQEVQLLSLAQAVELIRDIHRNEGGSGASSPSSSVTEGKAPWEMSEEELNNLTVTKEQLITRLRHHRMDRAIPDTKNAAATFYASQINLPDLPEIQRTRAQLAQGLQSSNSNDVTSMHNDNSPSIRSRASGGLPTAAVLPTASIGGSSMHGDGVDPDSYSPLHGTQAYTAAGGAGAGTHGGTPLGESYTRRTTSSASGVDGRGLSGAGTPPHAHAEGPRGLSARARALLPGVIPTASTKAMQWALEAIAAGGDSTDAMADLTSYVEAQHQYLRDTGPHAQPGGGAVGRYLSRPCLQELEQEIRPDSYSRRLSEGRRHSRGLVEAAGRELDVPRAGRPSLDNPSYAPAGTAGPSRHGSLKVEAAGQEQRQQQQHSSMYTNPAYEDFGELSLRVGPGGDTAAAHAFGAAMAAAVQALARRAGSNNGAKTQAGAGMMLATDPIAGDMWAGVMAAAQATPGPKAAAAAALRRSRSVDFVDDVDGPCLLPWGDSINSPGPVGPPPGPIAEALEHRLSSQTLSPAAIGSPGDADAGAPYTVAPERTSNSSPRTSRHRTSNSSSVTPGPRHSGSLSGLMLDGTLDPSTVRSSHSLITAPGPRFNDPSGIERTPSAPMVPMPMRKSSSQILVSGASLSPRPLRHPLPATGPNSAMLSGSGVVSPSLPVAYPAGGDAQDRSTREAAALPSDRSSGGDAASIRNTAANASPNQASPGPFLLELGSPGITHSDHSRRPAADTPFGTVGALRPSPNSITMPQNPAQRLQKRLGNNARGSPLSVMTSAATGTQPNDTHNTSSNMTTANSNSNLLMASVSSPQISRKPVSMSNDGGPLLHGRSNSGTPGILAFRSGGGASGGGDAGVDYSHPIGRSPLSQVHARRMYEAEGLGLGSSASGSPGLHREMSEGGLPGRSGGSLTNVRVRVPGVRPRRASVGSLGSVTAGHVRRKSWVANAPDGEASEGGTPSRAKHDKSSSLAMNNLLSNVLVAAWQTTQSVTTGRINQSMSRMLHAHAMANTGDGGAGTPATACSHSQAPVQQGGDNVSPSSGSPASNRVLGKPPSVRGVGRSMASMTALGLTPKAMSVVGGLPMHAALTLTAQLQLEEALGARLTQPFTSQVGVLLKRSTIKFVRAFWPMRAMDTVLQLAAAFIIGLIHGTNWGLSSVPGNVVMCMVCLCVLSTVAHLRTFSLNRVLLWRESFSGMSTLAYFLSQNIIDLGWVLAAPAVALGAYYYLTLPRMSFDVFYCVGLLVCWWASGMAYLVSAVLPPQNVLMAGVFISLIFGAFLHGMSPSIADARGSVLEGVLGLSYNRWAMEIISINEFRHYQDDMRNLVVMLSRGIGLCGVDLLLEDDGDDVLSPREAVSFLKVQYNFNMEYCDRYENTAYLVLMGLGLAFRVLAYLLLRWNCVRRH